MIVKETKQPYRNFTFSQTGISPNGFNTNIVGSLPACVDRIEYESGPQRLDGHCNWKACNHTWTNMVRGQLGSYEIAHVSNSSYHERSVDTRPNGLSGAPSLPTSVVWDRSTYSSCLDQLDLNCHDAVMAYSGIVQAVPMIGGCFRINRILKDIVTHFGKNVRRKPFTTVLKSVISADFINRFVIQTTLDDIRKASDSMNYVLRVLETARQRNEAPFCLENSSRKIYSESVRSFSLGPGNVDFTGDRTTRVESTSSCFVLVEAGYNTNAIRPIQLWAARCGLNRPLESFWDLVPFSFVLDYFARTGEFLEGLSNEMSDQDSLRARITKIHDAWGTLSVSAKEEFKVTGMSKSRLYNWIRQEKGSASISSGKFQRFRVPIPWRELSDWNGADGFFNVDLTKNRVKTLVELLIQAKA